MPSLPSASTTRTRPWLHGHIPVVRGRLGRTNALVLLIAALLGRPSVAHAQASLAAEDISDDVDVVADDGVHYQFTLIRDAGMPSKWYYVPTRPRLVEWDRGGGRQPEFSLVRYQYTEKQKVVENGLLQFGCTLAAPLGVVAKLKAYLVDKGYKSPDVSALIPETAEVALYTLAPPNALIASAPMGDGAAPLFATQSMAFAVPLTRIGSDVMDALSKGNMGVPVAVTLTFNGLTPAGHVKVHVNWSKVADHYSKDENFRVSASYLGWFGATYQSTRQEIYESLKRNGDVTVEEELSDKFTAADASKFVDPILQLINSVLLEEMKPPAKLPPASAAAPQAGGSIVSAGYSVAVKHVTDFSSLQADWDFRVRFIVKRKTAFKGFIGIGNYPVDVQKRAVTVIPAGEAQAAYMVLPPVAGLDEVGIAGLTLQANLARGQEPPIQGHVATWTLAGGWKCFEEESATWTTCSSLSFPLLNIDRNGLTISTSVDLTSPQGTIKTQSKSQLTLGEQIPVTSVTQSFVKVIQVDASALTFGGTGAPAQKLIKADVRVQRGSEIFSGTLKPQRLSNGTEVLRPLRWLLPAESAKGALFDVSVKFLRGDGSWRTKDVRLEPPYDLTLVDPDWQ
jgi:hypothetical protein